ncbi:MAG: DUF1232 domain-containing protein [bacterium]|nr:DUF1232 domain-containing protein [bacterium]
MRGLFSILFNLPKYLRLSWRLMKDPRVPWYGKLILVLAVLYAISPFDLIPEAFFPPLGIWEDLLLLLFSIQNLIRSSPEEVATEHARAIELKTRPKS